jgi:TolB-like protein/class 3 adenylate cyclase
VKDNAYLTGNGPDGRKLIAIVHADMVGYSRLIGQDDVGTMTRLRALRRDLIDPAVRHHGGSIFQTAGDSLLILFDSLDGAVSCAVRIQERVPIFDGDQPAMREIRFRIGINIGDVIADGTDVHGESVNVAVRLQAECPVGGIYVSQAVRDQVGDRIGIPFESVGLLTLKNIVKPIQTFALRIGQQGNHTEATPPPPPIVGKATGAPRLSFVVLPFVNLGRDRADDYFVDGITENLTTDLSRIRGSFVIACSSALTYRGRAVDARQVGFELAVRYVMEGSVQVGADRLRINAQLIEAETGSHLWAERFDKARGDIFEMQDEITTRLARSFGVEIVGAESRRAERERPDNMDAFDLCLRAQAIRNRPFSIERLREARELFEAALRLDNQNIDALIGLAGTHATEVIASTPDDPAIHLRAAEAAITRALTLAPDSAQGHYVRARVMSALRAPADALRECALAIQLDPNFAWAHAWSGAMKLRLGLGEETATDIGEAERRSPRDPRLHAWHLIAGNADLHLGKLDAAINRFRRSIELCSTEGLSYLYLAAALALADREREATEARAEGMRLIPHFRIGRFRANTVGDNPTFLAQRERIYEGLQRAGVPA